MVKYKRILLKLSGEALMAEDHSPISSQKLNDFVSQIKEIADMGVQVGIVIGGGNIFRGLKGTADGIDRITGDYMGMMATVINSLALKSALTAIGAKARVLTAIRMEPVADYYSREKANDALNNGEIVVFAAGTSNPFFTTDTASTLRAVEIGADIIIKATNVDGIYTADPRKDPSATMYDEISFDEAYSRNLKVMDLTAFAMCKDNNLPIIVFNIHKKGNLKEIVSGKKIGTIVKN